MKTKIQLAAISIIMVAFSISLISCNKDGSALTKTTSVHNSDNSIEKVDTANLVARYTFNGDVHDHSGHHNGVTFNNATPTAGRRGIANTAYYFDGSSYMVVPNSPSLNPSQITLAALFKPTGFYTGNGETSRILMKGVDDQSNGHYFLGFYNNGVIYGTYGDNQFQSNGVGSAENTLQLNKWYRVVYTYDGSVGKLYINDVLVNQVTKTATFNPNDSPLRIGKTGRSDFPYWFNGIIDEIRIYNVAVSELQAQKISKSLEE